MVTMTKNEMIAEMLACGAVDDAGARSLRSARISRKNVAVRYRAMTQRESYRATILQSIELARAELDVVRSSGVLDSAPIRLRIEHDERREWLDTARQTVRCAPVVDGSISERAIDMAVVAIERVREHVQRVERHRENSSLNMLASQ